MRRDAAGRGSRGTAGRIRLGRARPRSAGARTRTRRPLGPAQSGADRNPAVRIPARRDRDPARQRRALSAGVRRPGETHARSTDRAARHRSCCALRADEQRRDRRRNGLARNRARLDTRSRGARRIAGRRGPLRRGAPQSQEAADRRRQRPRKRIHAADPHACQCPGQASRSEARTQSRRRLSQARRGAFCRRAGGSQRGRRTRCARGSPQGWTAAAGLGGGRPARSASAAEGLGGSGRIVARRLSEKISCGAGNAPRLRALAGGAKTLWRGTRRVPEAHGQRSRQHRRGLRGGAAFPAAQGLRRYGEVLARQGKLDEARVRLQQAAAKNSQQRVQLILAEAQLLRDANQPKTAFDLVGQALDRVPNNPELLYDYAMLAEKIERVDILEASLRKLIEIRPEHAHAYNALGYSLADRNQRLPEARELIEKALQLAPDDSFIIDSMGWVLYRMGNLKDSLGYLRRAFAGRPDPEIAAHLGEVLWAMGERAEAERVWGDATRETPDNETLANTIKRLKR